MKFRVEWIVYAIIIAAAIASAIWEFNVWRHCDGLFVRDALNVPRCLDVRTK